MVEPGEGGWSLRDVGSRNGTWIDGSRVEGPRRLVDGERFRLGPAGPEIRVHLGPQGRTAVIRRLARENTVLRRGLIGMGALVIVAAALGSWAWSRRDAGWEQERAELLDRTARLLEESRGAVERLEGEVGGLAEALEGSRAEVGSLQAAVQEAERRPTEAGVVDQLRSRLQEATQALARQQLAASLDFSAIERLNRRALAMVFVEPDSGGVTTATAFAVRPDGTLITNRHVVMDEEGRPALRIGVQFADSRQVWRARVTAVAEDADLAVLKVDDIVGGNPVVHGINPRGDTLAAGAPVALLGFPLAVGAERPRPLVTAGVVSSWGVREVRVQGYGAEGASGSPIFDADGRLLGVLYGGTGEGAGRSLLAVPAAAVEALLLRPR